MIDDGLDALALAQARLAEPGVKPRGMGTAGAWLRVYGGC